MIRMCRAVFGMGTESLKLDILISVSQPEHPQARGRSLRCQCVIIPHPPPLKEYVDLQTTDGIIISISAPGLWVIPES